jgi:hypothetical protein
MIREVEGSAKGATAWRSDRGFLEVRRPSAAVVHFIEEGYLEADFADLIQAALDRALEQGEKLHIFVDAFDLEGYDPRVRASATDWLREHRARVVVQHMLVRSKITRMGLSVASLALGGVLEGHSARASFDAVLARVVRETLRPSATL